MPLKLKGSTSGSVELDVPAVVGGDVSLELPGAGKVDRLERAGNIVQVVHVRDGVYASGTGTISIDNTTPQNTEGTEFMSLAITPTSATNKLLIIVNAFLIPSTTDWINAGLFQDSTVDAIASWPTYQPQAGGSANSNFSHYMTAGTTSTTTFRFRAGKNASGTTYFNGGTLGALFNGTSASTMTIMEIAA